jgi:hypothetical protein
MKTVLARTIKRQGEKKPVGNFLECILAAPNATVAIGTNRQLFLERRTVRQEVFIHVYPTL